ncbi:hypothetical protein CKO25_09555 [Thiocapsa imhoffii]|uniref:Uncharacterized protein n=1 Tax=Thiocapsa imhoffii TaxID=382777 RepID=A0A9X0WI31_9GAMM|nr:hypothetical protein [Thiocapsa imhoffii]MBK1644890.1 hypothetical protein [Thiocapsa imhoffii]
MEQIKKTAEYRIFQKKSGRYAVRTKKKAWLHGEEKEQVLLNEQLITRPRPKASEPTPATETEEVAAG